MAETWATKQARIANEPPGGSREARWMPEKELETSDEDSMDENPDWGTIEMLNVTWSESYDASFASSSTPSA
ncbi:hypothetical protein PI124_g786 [Phytophthora idaei]|nr:hypothetical protein PI125_g24252 [Phytophthora idaei]KAG3165849.1 hypothetical protein PI126_g4453 [Phytophthora idaei]KAG3254670.1 hypothetical protein PI124_g786 [Phytophthora idaei]